MFTKHDTINEMLVATGSRPLPEAQSNHPLYVKAELILDRITTSVHSLGLWYNTDVKTLLPNDPVDTDRIDPALLEIIKVDATDRAINLTIRNGRVFDVNKQFDQVNSEDGYSFPDGVEAKVSYSMTFENTQIVVQEYIRAKAVYEFYLNEDGSDPKLSFYKRNLDEKFSIVKREDIRNRQTNIYDNPNNAINKLRRGRRPTYRSGPTGMTF